MKTATVTITINISAPKMYEGEATEQIHQIPLDEINLEDFDLEAIYSKVEFLLDQACIDFNDVNN